MALHELPDSPPYSGCKVYGPYLANRDGRLIVKVFRFSKQLKTMNYARWLVEVKLREVLPPEQDVHHVDGNKNNNNLANLKVISREDHFKTHAAPSREFICPVCSTRFTRALHAIKITHKSGPFCSKSCTTRFRYTKVS